MTMDEPGYLNAPDLIEECAEAVYNEPTMFDGDAVGTHLSNSWMIEASAETAQDLSRLVMGVCGNAASAVLSVLLKRGCLSDIGIEQLRASQERAK